VGTCGLDASGLGQGPVTESFEHSNERGEFGTSWVIVSFSRVTLCTMTCGINTFLCGAQCHTRTCSVVFTVCRLPS